MKKKGTVEAYICCVLLAFMVLFMFAEVVARYVFKHSIYWAEELIRYMFIWFIFLGAAYCIKLRNHVTIDMFLSLFPKKLQKYMLIVGHVVWLVLSVFVVYWGFKYVMRLYGTMELTTALKMPLFIVYLALPVGFACMAVRLAVDLFRGRIQGMDDDPPEGLPEESSTDA